MIFFILKDGRFALHELCRSPCRNEDVLAEIALSLIDSGTHVDMKSSSQVSKF